MLAFEHWGLDPDRDKIQFRILGDQSVQAQAIAQNVIDGGYLELFVRRAIGAPGISHHGRSDKDGHSVSGPGRHGEAQLDRQNSRTTGASAAGDGGDDHFRQQSGQQNVVVKSLMKELRLTKVEDAQAGYEMMRVLFEKRIYPNVDGLRNVIRLLGRTSEPIRKLKVEDIIDDRMVRKLEKEGLF